MYCNIYNVSKSYIHFFFKLLNKICDNRFQSPLLINHGYYIHMNIIRTNQKSECKE